MEVKMYDKVRQCVVKVYRFNEDGRTALIFCPRLANKGNNGWLKVKLSALIPMDYYSGGYIGG